MECDENGGERKVPAATRGRGFKRKRGARRKSSVQLALTLQCLTVPSTSCSRPMHINLVPDCPPNLPHTITSVQPANPPFMNNMDEISYWIFTKKAPCLLNYDNVIKTQVEQAHCSKTKPASHKSVTEVVQTPKKKRKLKLLNDDSVSTERQQKIYFETSQNQNEKTAQSSCKSGTDLSEIGFNVKNISAQNKAKRMKLQKKIQNMHKKNKIVTSTPTVNLRRSLRKAQQNNNNSHLNSSFEILNTSLINGKKELGQQPLKKSEKVVDERNKHINTFHEKGRNKVNGQFEDFSDVSGFTANYIRSTKLHSSKTPRKLRSRNRPVVKNTKPRAQNDKVIVCINKSVNTGLPDKTALNCSTDSSQNILNLVTIKNNEQSNRVNKSTSLLKFVETNLNHDNGNICNNKSPKQESGNNLNVSFQSRSSGISRYPRRHVNNIGENPEQNCSTNKNSNINSPCKTYNIRRGKSNNMNQKKNSDDNIVSKTRSGRNISFKLDMAEAGCSVININDSSDHVSTNVVVNVAHPEENEKKNNPTTRCLRSRKGKSNKVFKGTSSNESERKEVDGKNKALVQSKPKCVKRVKKSVEKIGHSLSRVSLRDKSGFAACFSDSDSDSEPLKQQKFFC